MSTHGFPPIAFGLNATPVAIMSFPDEMTWEFPKDPFIEYETKDEWWCRRLGLGREVMKPMAYRLGGTIVVNRAAFDLLQKQLDPPGGEVRRNGVPV